MILFSVGLKATCESLEQSKWINGVCYFFHNKEVRSFYDAKKVCLDEATKFGYNNGRLYEPRDANIFAQVYKLAEEFSKHLTIQIWLGMTDFVKEGQFTYVSDGQTSKIVAPWGGNLFTLLAEMQPWVLIFQNGTLTLDYNINKTKGILVQEHRFGKQNL